MVSSAWSKAVPNLLDNIDTYPGLSSDWAADSSGLGGAQVGVMLDTLQFLPLTCLLYIDSNRRRSCQLLLSHSRQAII